MSCTPVQLPGYQSSHVAKGKEMPEKGISKHQPFAKSHVIVDELEASIATDLNNDAMIEGMHLERQNMFLRCPPIASALSRIIL